MTDPIEIGMLALIAIAAFCIPAKERILTWIILAYTVAWALVYHKAPELWTVALLGFVQNVAFTFVSRGRNSGSLGYHFAASIFSNGIYAALLFVSIDQVSQAKSMPLLFLAIYTLATMSGSIFAHWFALKIEKGKGKNVQEDKFTKLQTAMVNLERRLGVGPVSESLFEGVLPDGRTYRVWGDIEQHEGTEFRLSGLLKDPSPVDDVPSCELARQWCEALRANAVQIGGGAKGGSVYYRDWP